MKTEIIVENEQNKYEFTDELNALLKKAVEGSLALESFEVPSEISVLLVDDEEIREINKEQRDIDRATDVLSFPMTSMVNGVMEEDTGDYDMDEELLLLGDIVISMETTQRQAEEYGHSFEREFAFLVTHGMFHLMGYDHMVPEEEKIMIGKQEEVLKKIGLTRE
jgi:metalloprotein, YbeY/UPF0054 family